MDTKSLNTTIQAKLDNCASIFNKTKIASDGKFDLLDLDTIGDFLFKIVEQTRCT